VLERRIVVALVTLATTGVPACGSGGEPPAAQRADDCIVRLHGKGGKGSSTTVSNSVADLNPSGNAAGWGGRQWLYFPQEEYDAARAIVTAAVDTTGCKRVVIDGFSNGASFAASLLCHNETLDGRLLGVVIDDPVTDASTEKCARSASVNVALYWTGALDTQAPPGTACAPIDWTCEGGAIVGIETYASRLEATVQRSPSSAHEWFLDAPELEDWFRS
jgi:hypothetical protein